MKKLFKYEKNKKKLIIETYVRFENNFSDIYFRQKTFNIFKYEEYLKFAYGKNYETTC